MKCATCRKPIGSSDRRRRYCSEFCKANAKKKPRFRVVGADERPAEAVPVAPRKLTVDVAAREGTDLEFLMSLRDRLADEVASPTCPPRDLAALTRRLQDIAKEIEAIDLRAKEEGADAADVVEDEAWDAAAI